MIDEPQEESAANAAQRLINHEQELAKIEEQRILSLENQATAILTLGLAIAAFGASSIDHDTLKNHRWPIGAVAVFLLLSGGFAVAARGPRALKVSFWTAWQKGYRRVEARLQAAEEAIGTGLPEAGRAEVIVESWRARRMVSVYLAERKALWVTCSLGCLLLAFASGAIAALVLIG